MYETVFSVFANECVKTGLPVRIGHSDSEVSVLCFREPDDHQVSSSSEFWIQNSEKAESFGGGMGTVYAPQKLASAEKRPVLKRIRLQLFFVVRLVLGAPIVLVRGAAVREELPQEELRSSSGRKFHRIKPEAEPRRR